MVLLFYLDSSLIAHTLSLNHVFVHNLLTFLGLLNRIHCLVLSIKLNLTSI